MSIKLSSGCQVLARYQARILPLIPVPIGR